MSLDESRASLPERNRAVEDSHQKNYLAAPRFARIVRFVPKASRYARTSRQAWGSVTKPGRRRRVERPLVQILVAVGFYQGAQKPLGLSGAGHSDPVSSMPLKGTSEARGKPPKCWAWLRGRMVSPNEVVFDLRGKTPLAQDLARWASKWGEETDMWLVLPAVAA